MGIWSEGNIGSVSMISRIWAACCATALIISAIGAIGCFATRGNQSWEQHDQIWLPIFWYSFGFLLVSGGVVTVLNLIHIWVWAIRGDYRP